MDTRLSRRQFLMTSGASVLALSLGNLEWAAAVSDGAAGATAAIASIPSYRTWEDVYRQQVGLGQSRAQQPLGELLVPGALRLERVRQGRHGLARGAGGRLPADPPRRLRLQPARLPEGRLLQRAHVRPDARQVSAQARRRARLGEVAAHLLGAGARRDRRLDDRHDRQGRHRPGDLGPRPGHFARHADGGAEAACERCSTRRPRHEHRDRRRTPRRGGDLRKDRLRALGRRLLLLRPDPVLGLRTRCTPRSRTRTSCSRRATRARSSSASRPTTAPRRCTPTAGSR